MPLRALLSTLVPILALFTAAPAARADDVGGGGTDVDVPGAAQPPPARSRTVIHGQLNLSLPDAIKMGLENNLDVAIERFDPFIAYEDQRIAWGGYDPESFADFGYAWTESPNANALISGNNNLIKSYGGEGGIRGLLPFLNTQYNVQLEGSRTTSTVSIETLSPRYDSAWSASIQQPLLRNLIWNDAWTRVTSTRILYRTSEEDFRRQVMDVVQRIENAYWDLVATQEQRRVAEKSLETARALLDQTQTQYDVGVVSKVEVVEAEAGVAQRDFNLIVAENNYRNAQDALIDLVLGRGLTADSTMEVEPTDRPQDYVKYDIDRERAVETAFDHRPELNIADQEIERREIDLKFRKNQRLPQLDARGSYGNEGLAGKQNPNCVPPFCATPVPSTDYGDTYDNWLAHPRQWTVGGLFSIPLGNIAGRHGVSKSELELRKSVTQKVRVEQNIILEVRKAVRDLKSAQEGIEASRRAQLAAEEQLRSARIRLEYGESTPFDVLLREEDFVQAESDLIRAFQVYRTSATALDRSQGTILRSNNIQIDAVRALR